MSRKIKIIIIIATLLFISVIVFVYFFASEKNEGARKPTVQKVKDFAQVWGSYKDEASDEYLETLKPYLTDELYANYQSSAEALKAMQMRYGPSPESSFEPESSVIKSQEADTMITVVTGRRKTPIIDEDITEYITITYKKTDKGWKIESITSQKENK